MMTPTQRELIKNVSVASVIFACAAISFPSSAQAENKKVASCATIQQVKKEIKQTALPCLDGGVGATVQAIRGPVLINVWGSWCDPCKQEIPFFVTLAKLKKVSIVGIDVEESSMSSGRKFVLAHQMTWPNLYDPDGRTKGVFGMGVPVTWFIDTSGKVVYKQIGVIHSQSDLFHMVKKYLKVSL